ncbi:ATP-binding protein [Candidatus Pelagibacter ubique]|nr:ATP-binding protein [Candidatus Pelagibacter ubique]MDC0484271.1 ATP-binding protein [Candidatus Pelagibacter ubique]
MNKTFSATLSNLKNIRLFVTNFLNDYELEMKLINNIKLAVDESVSNIIKHGYKGEDENNKIEIKLELIKKKLSIHLFDNGTPVNQKNIQPRNLKDIKPGGLGSYFINEIMDEVKWETKSKDWVNHLILIKKIY